MNPRPTWTPELEDEIDSQFINDIISQITTSCVLPFQLPPEQVVSKILLAAKYFWENVDTAVEKRFFVIKRKDICDCNAFNKTIQLPDQIQSVYGVRRVDEGLKYGAMGDFSMERMLMSTYSAFGGPGMVGTASQHSWNLTDMVVSLYEVSTFQEVLNPPVTFDFNPYSKKLVVLGALGQSDIVIQTFTRVRIQDLYQSYYFIQLVIGLCKQAMGSIYSVWRFKYPGGVEMDVSPIVDDGKDLIDQVHEWVENTRGNDIIFMTNTM